MNFYFVCSNLRFFIFYSSRGMVTKEQRKKFALELLGIIMSPIILACLIVMLGGIIIVVVFVLLLSLLFLNPRFKNMAEEIYHLPENADQAMKQFGLTSTLVLSNIFGIGLVYPIVLVVFLIGSVFLLFKLILDIILDVAVFFHRLFTCKLTTGIREQSDSGEEV